MDSIHSLADGVCLQDERHVDGDRHQQRHDNPCDASCICRSGDRAPVPSPIWVCLNPIAHAIQSKEKSSEEAEKQRQEVKCKERMTSILCFCEDRQDKEHCEARAHLSTVVDRKLYVVVEGVVEVAKVECDRGAISLEYRDTLVVWVGGRTDDGHLACRDDD